MAYQHLLHYIFVSCQINKTSNNWHVTFFSESAISMKTLSLLYVLGQWTGTGWCRKPFFLRKSVRVWETAWHNVTEVQSSEIEAQKKLRRQFCWKCLLFHLPLWEFFPYKGFRLLHCGHTAETNESFIENWSRTSQTYLQRWSVTMIDVPKIRYAWAYKLVLALWMCVNISTHTHKYTCPTSMCQMIHYAVLCCTV